MPAEEVRITLRNLDADECPEVRLEFHREGHCYFVTFVSSTSKDGTYDKVGIKIDLNEDGMRDAKDIDLLTRLAQAALPLLTVAT
jgi:hypothetical protein